MRPAFASLLLLLAACGGSGPSVGSVEEAADLIGCSDVERDDEMLFVTEGAVCDRDGERVWVMYFASNEARDNYVEVGEQMGGLMLVGDHFVVDAKPDTVRSLAEEVDGEVKP